MWQLTAHLVRRQVATTYRGALLGWTWPVIRQLAQLGVLVLVFDGVLDLGIEDYPLFVFSGLLAWSWFSTGLQDATWALFTYRHLVFRAGFRTAILPTIPVLARLVDLLLALPVLIVLVLVSGDLSWTLAFMPVLIAVQVLLMVSIAWLAAAGTVFLRDVPNIIVVGLLLLFYVTPIFYDPSAVPERYDWIINLNPMALLLGAYRDIAMFGALPDALDLTKVILFAGGFGAFTLFVFQRWAPGFVDEM